MYANAYSFREDVNGKGHAPMKSDRSKAVATCYVVILLLLAFLRQALAWRQDQGSPALVAAALAAVLVAFEAFAPGGPAETRRPQRRLFVFVAVCCAVGAFLFDLEKMAHVVSGALLSPYPNDPMEGREAVKAWLVSQGVDIYSELSGYPYLVTLYGPVYYLLLSVCPGLAAHPLAVGRTISLVCYALVSLLCLVYTWKNARSVLAVAVLSLFFAGFPLYGWGYAVKPDMLAWLAALAGLLVLAWPGQRSHAGWGVAACAGTCFALAAFTKFQSVAAPVAGLAWLILSGRAVLALRVALVAALLWGVSCVAAQMITHGQFVRQTILFPAYFSRLEAFNSYAVAARRFLGILADHWSLASVAVLGMAVRRVARAGWFLETCLAVFSLTAFFALKWHGSASNNFIGMFFVMCLLAGDFVGRLPLETPAGRMAGVLALLALVTFPSHFALKWDRPQPNLTRLTALRSLPRLTSAPLLVSTEAASSYIGLYSLEKLKLFDAFELKFYGGFSGFDFLESSIASDIKNRRCGFIVDDRPEAPPAFRHLARVFYETHSTWDAMPVLAPRQGDVLILNSLQSVENFGDSTVALAGVENVRQVGDILEPALPGRAAFVRVVLTLRPGAGQVGLRYFPGILGLNSAVEAEVSDDEIHWRPWFSYDTVIGFNEQFWGDSPQEAFIRPESGKLHVRLNLRGHARLWLSAESPMAFYVR